MTLVLSPPMGVGLEWTTVNKDKTQTLIAKTIGLKTLVPKKLAPQKSAEQKALQVEGKVLGERRMTSAKAVDAKLVKRVQQGDKRAYDVLVIKYQPRVLSIVSRYVRNLDDAHDVSQEAFIKAYRALGNFRGDSAFYTWLYRIATNTAKNFLVSRGRRPPGSDVELEDAEYYGGSEGLKDVASPEQLLYRDELQAMIHKAVEELPEDLRSAVMLREMDGMSYEEIAEILDCPVGTVRSRIFRARDAIDKQVAPLLDHHIR